MDNLASIAEVANSHGVTYRALRYYEDRELVRPKRVGKGQIKQRWYGPEERDRLDLVTSLITAGFTLRQVREVIAVDDPDLRKQTMAKIAKEVRKRLARDIKKLMSKEKAVGRLIRNLS